MRSLSIFNILEEDGQIDKLSLTILFQSMMMEDFRLRGIFSPAILGTNTSTSFAEETSVASQMVAVKQVTNSTNEAFYLLGEGGKTWTVRPGERQGTRQGTITSEILRIHPRRSTQLVLSRDDIRTSTVDAVAPLMAQLIQDVREYVEWTAFITLVNAARRPARFKDGRRVHGPGKRITIQAASLAAAFAETEAGAEAFHARLGQLGLLWTEANNTNPRMMFVHPYIKELVLPKAPNLINRDLNPSTSAGYATQEVRDAGGMRLLPTSNHLPNRVIGVNDEILGDDIPESYRGNFTRAAGHGLPVAVGGAPDMVRKPIAALVAPGDNLLMEANRLEHSLTMQASVWFAFGVFFPPTAGSIEIIPN